MQNYYPTPYQPQQSTVAWVQGEGEARAYPVPAGSSMLMLDATSEMFYIKSVDASGMPHPLRIYEYSEVVQAPEVKMDGYATKEDIQKIHERLDQIMKGNQNAKQYIQPVERAYAEPVNV